MLIALALGSPREISVYNRATVEIPHIISPTAALSDPETSIVNLVYDGLTSVDENLDVQPSLSPYWVSNSDSTRFEFAIRRDAFFHDGSQVTPGDVVSCLQTATLKRNQAHGALRDIQEVREERGKVIIETRRPLPVLPSLLAAPALRIYRLDEPSIGSGPFRVVSHRPDSVPPRVVLKRFEQYYGERPAIDTYNMIELSESEAYRLVSRGEVHDTSLFHFGEYRGPKFGAGQYVRGRATTTWVVSMNTSKDPLDSLEARECLWSVFPQERIVSEVIPHHTRAGGLVPPGLPGFNPALDRPGNGRARCQRLRGRELELDYPELVEGAGRICAIIAEAAAVHDVRVTCQGRALSTVLERMETGEADLSFFGMSLDYPIVGYFFWTFDETSKWRVGSFSSSRLATLMERLRVSTTSMEVGEAMKRIDEHLHKNRVTLNMSYPPLGAYVHQCVRGVNLNPAGPGYVDYRSVSMSLFCDRTEDFTTGEWE